MVLFALCNRAGCVPLYEQLTLPVLPLEAVCSCNVLSAVTLGLQIALTFA